jgi:hypothetical protein
MLCEGWGVEYKDLLISKEKPAKAKSKKPAKAKKPAKLKAKMSNGNGNGHSENVESGEVIFDATSSKSVLEQLS